MYIITHKTKKIKKHFLTCGFPIVNRCVATSYQELGIEFSPVIMSQ
jgi:hypothetical protein